MKVAALFDVKNRFSEICEAVSKTGEPIIVTRRGVPLVRIVPEADSTRPTSVWDSVEECKTKHGPLPDDWKLPTRKTSSLRPDPLAD